MAKRCLTWVKEPVYGIIVGCMHTVFPVFERSKPQARYDFLILRSSLALPYRCKKSRGELRKELMLALKFGLLILGLLLQRVQQASEAFVVLVLKRQDCRREIR